VAQNRSNTVQKAKILPFGIPGIQPKEKGDADDIMTLQQHKKTYRNL